MKKKTGCILQIELRFYSFDEKLGLPQSIKSYLVKTVGIPSQFIEMQEMQETQFGYIFYVLFGDVDVAENFLVVYYSITANKIKQGMEPLIFRLSLYQDYQMFVAIKNYIFEKLSVFVFFNSFYGNIQ